MSPGTQGNKLLFIVVVIMAHLGQPDLTLGPSDDLRVSDTWNHLKGWENTESKEQLLYTCTLVPLLTLLLTSQKSYTVYGTLCTIDDHSIEIKNITTILTIEQYP